MRQERQSSGDDVNTKDEQKPEKTEYTIFEIQALLSESEVIVKTSR